VKISGKSSSNQSSWRRPHISTPQISHSAKQST